MSVQLNNIDDQLKIGSRATVDKIGFWGVTPVVQPTSSSQAAIGTLEDVTNTAAGTNTNSAINNNFATIKTLVNQLRSDLVNVGVIKGS